MIVSLPSEAGAPPSRLVTRATAATRAAAAAQAAAARAAALSARVSQRQVDSRSGRIMNKTLSARNTFGFGALYGETEQMKMKRLFGIEADAAIAGGLKDALGLLEDKEHEYTELAPAAINKLRVFVASRLTAQVDVTIKGGMEAMRNYMDATGAAVAGRAETPPRTLQPPGPRNEARSERDLESRHPRLGQSSGRGSGKLRRSILGFHLEGHIRVVVES